MWQDLYKLIDILDIKYRYGNSYVAVSRQQKKKD